MRLIWTGLALAALSSPAIGQDCRFFNFNGQSVDYRPEEKRLTFDPTFSDKVECAVVGPTQGNGFALACDDGPRSLVVGMSELGKPFVDIIVFDEVFYWLKCKETT